MEVGRVWREQVGARGVTAQLSVSYIPAPLSMGLSRWLYMARTTSAPARTPALATASSSELVYESVVMFSSTDLPVVLRGQSAITMPGGQRHDAAARMAARQHSMRTDKQTAHRSRRSPPVSTSSPLLMKAPSS